MKVECANCQGLGVWKDGDNENGFILKKCPECAGKGVVEKE